MRFRTCERISCRPPTGHSPPCWTTCTRADYSIRRARRHGGGIRQDSPDFSRLPEAYKLPGRDHWGRVQSVFLAGGGVVGGRVIGSSDRIGGHPATEPQTPENLGASIYRAGGIPALAAWHDELDRPHQVYHGEPIKGLV